jgi:two-component system, NarL family, invasion response regulator UvrY
MIRVIIADDHPVVRQGLKQVVNKDPQIEVVGEANDAAELLELARRVSFDVLVLDITMPGRSGLEVLKELRREQPSLPVLILSMHPEDQYAVRVLKAGAAGYLTKESAPEQLVSAIKKAYEGGKYISPETAERLAFHIEADSRDEPHHSLSDREFQVMRALAQGQSVTQIAHEMGLSAKTVSTYRTRVLEKMRVSSNSELIRYAVRHGLIY